MWSVVVLTAYSEALHQLFSLQSSAAGLHNDLAMTRQTCQMFQNRYSLSSLQHIFTPEANSAKTQTDTSGHSNYYQLIQPASLFYDWFYERYVFKLVFKLAELWKTVIFAGDGLRFLFSFHCLSSSLPVSLAAANSLRYQFIFPESTSCFCRCQLYKTFNGSHMYLDPSSPKVCMPTDGTCNMIQCFTSQLHTPL